MEDRRFMEDRAPEMVIIFDFQFVFKAAPTNISASIARPQETRSNDSHIYYQRQTPDILLNISTTTTKEKSTVRFSV